MAKEKKISWTAIIVICMVFILFIILLGDYNSEKNLKTITISGINEEVTITNPEPSKIYISGMNAIAYFSKNSNPKEIYLSGMNSIAYLCKEAHNPIVKSSGMGARVVYSDC